MINNQTVNEFSVNWLLQFWNKQLRAVRWVAFSWCTALGHVSVDSSHSFIFYYLVLCYLDDWHCTDVSKWNNWTVGVDFNTFHHVWGALSGLPGDGESHTFSPLSHWWHMKCWGLSHESRCEPNERGFGLQSKRFAKYPMRKRHHILLLWQQQ